MRILFNFIIIFHLVVAVDAQENAAIKDLLTEAETKIYSQPEQAGKIAEYILDKKENPNVQAEALLLLSKSFYVRGNYNQAIKNALEAEKLPKTSESLEIKLKATFFTIQLLRELGLGTVANIYREKLADFEKGIQNKSLSLWFHGKMKQDRAFVHFQDENFSEAKQLLHKSKSVFLMLRDTSAIAETTLGLAQIYMETEPIDSTKIYMERVRARSNNFQKMQALTHLGTVYFKKKNYNKSVEIFQEALSISSTLHNKQFESTSLNGLTVAYLALENTQQFFSYKQRANITSTQVETDKNMAVNSVYNFTNSYQKELSEQKLHKAQLQLYLLVGFFLLLFGVGIIINYGYVSKTKLYGAIWKYIQPKEPNNTDISTLTLEKSSIVPIETEYILLQKLDKFESGKKFTNPDMSIALLASQFDTNTKYLSEVINRQKGKNFNSYINELRINYIIEKLKTDAVYFNYKVSYLAAESGFSSHSSFATVFKSVTGISPTKFMEFLQKRIEKA